MYPLVEAYGDSEMGMTEFCEEHGLSVGTFSYWRRKYASEQEGHFLELGLVASQDRMRWVVRIKRGDWTIEFSEMPPLDYLRGLQR